MAVPSYRRETEAEKVSPTPLNTASHGRAHISAQARLVLLLPAFLDPKPVPRGIVFWSVPGPPSFICCPSPQPSDPQAAFAHRVPCAWNAPSVSLSAWSLMIQFNTASAFL